MTATVQARVIAEETISAFEEPNNGAGPMWCFGSRTIAREGNTVFAVVPETGTDVQPLCNTRWVLYRRRDGGTWERLQANPTFDEREPCMLALQPGGRLILSVNPAQELTGTYPDGRREAHCAPRLLQFATAHPEAAPTVINPVWNAAYYCSEHSYRALATDPETGTLFLTNQVPVDGDYQHAYSVYGGDGTPLKQGVLHFPMRGCYQQIALRGRAVYVMAISDEVEPNQAWRAFKLEKTGQHWDYDFRQLFFTWTPDIATTPFSPILTVASVDETAGLIRNLDMAVDARGTAHLLYLERNVWHDFMRDRFFPGLPITVSLKYARITSGRVTHRETLVQAVEKPAPGQEGVGPFAGPVPEYGVFHTAQDGRLFLLWQQSGQDAGLYLRPVAPEGGPAQRLPVEKPLAQFFAAGTRNGCAPSDTIDVYGVPAGERLIRYLQIRLEAQ